MKTRTLFGCAALAAAFFVPTTSHAQDAHGFGSQTQLILSADRLVPLLSYSRTSVTRNDGGVELTSATSTTSASLLWGGRLGPDTVHTIPRVGIDVAIGSTHLTLGGSAVLAFTLGGSRSSESIRGGTRFETTVDAPSTTVFGFVPRVGYIIPVGDVLAIWLRGGLAFYSVRTKTFDDDANNHDIDRATAFSIDLDPQLTIVPLEHFFIGLGPLVNIPVAGSLTREQVRGPRTDSRSDDLRLLQIGATASLGGWFNL
jgi:hypothetical protein